MAETARAATGAGASGAATATGAATLTGAGLAFLALAITDAINAAYFVGAGTSTVV